MRLETFLDLCNCATAAQDGAALAENLFVTQPLKQEECDTKKNDQPEKLHVIYFVSYEFRIHPVFDPIAHEIKSCLGRFHCTVVCASSPY